MDEIKYKIFGTEELIQLFDELTKQNQNKILKAGFRKSGKIILDQAKQNLQSGKKITTKKRIEKRFRMEDLKENSEIQGVNIGNSSFMAKWLEDGTASRTTKGRKKKAFRKGEAIKAHSTGRITGLHFLQKATEEKGEAAVTSIYQNIKQAFDKLINKYSKIK